jgi:hypothetical protein
MKALFNNAISPNDPNYSALRDDPRHNKLKDYCLELWQIYHPFADPNFPKEFANNLHARFWELYLGVYLLEQGVELIPKRSSVGPDFQFMQLDRRYWIEATAPGEGEGPDAVPSLEEHSGRDPVPEDKIILRFTNAISKKKEQFQDYLDTGVVESDDVLIIAVNGRGIRMLMFDGPLPAIVKSVYPFGNYVVTVDSETAEVIREGYQTRHAIQKDSGAEVSTSAFLDPEFSIVSGVLYSSSALWDLPLQPGREFLFVHNSLASNPVEAGWLNVGYEYYKDGDNIFVKAH